MNERVELPAVPTWLAALPFLFSARSRSDEDLLVNSALGSAVAALAADPERRDSRSRISFLLAELATQHSRRTGDPTAWIPVTRAQLARAAQIKLTNVKRILGFLLLSGVIELGDEGIRILDWQRLCKLGGYDRSWIPVQLAGEDEPAAAVPSSQEQKAPAVTAAGDPASFV